MADDPKKALAANVSKGMARSFGSEFIKGLTIGGVIMGSALARPKTPSTDMGSDWDAIGRDVRIALRKYAARVS